MAHGDDRPPRRPPGGVVVGALAVLVAAGLTVSALRGEDAVPGPVVSATPSATPPLPGEPEEPGPPLSGPVTRAVSGRLVVRLGMYTSLVDLRTGRSDRLDTPGPVGETIRVGRGVVLLGYRGASDAGALYVLTPDQRVREVPGRATAVVADAAGSGFWATTYPDGRGPGRVSHHSLSGRRLAGPVTLPDGYAVHAAYPGGLVLGHDDGDGVLFWDPARRATVHAVPGVRLVAATPRRVVWQDRCDGPCPMYWFDLPNDFDGVGICGCGSFEVVAERVPTTAELSPDGRWLALAATGERTELTFCAVETGRCVRPDNAVTTGHVDLEWTADGRTVLIGGGFRIGAWRPGWPEVRLIPGDHPGDGIATLGP